MTEIATLKVGIIGLGNIGRVHMRNMMTINNTELVGVCDYSKDNADKCAVEYQTKAFYTYADLFEHSGLEAVIIAVPHTEHAAIAIEAFSRGIHVLCEKPLAIHVNEARKINEAYEVAKKVHPGLTFAMMFQERTLPLYRKIKQIVESGELGQLMRATWINTEWFRSQAYYDSSGWRATWKGEGGGILTNQCPHNLDFYQWVFGEPKRISGHAHLGKYHNIEVEDEVTAYFEHENGMIGHLMVSTAESPGTNRLEIVGVNGKLIYDNHQLVLHRYEMSTLKFLKESNDGFKNVDSTEEKIEVSASDSVGHTLVTEVFVNKALTGVGELIAEGTEGMKSIMIANGIMLSSFTGRMIETPYDGDEYERILNGLIQSSQFVKPATQVKSSFADRSITFSK
jgi:predicted dehydrogenase